MSDKASNAWRATLQRRTIVAAAFVAVWVTAIQARLVYLQVIAAADLSARATDQQSDTLGVPGKRGTITDRNGELLAYSVEAYSIQAEPPKLAGDPAVVAAAICDALGDCTAQDRRSFAERLGQKEKKGFDLRRQVSPDARDRVMALDLDGISFRAEDKRFYPNRELAAHVLGFVGLDHNGLAGIENAYDSLIKGEKGQVIQQTDSRGRPYIHRILKAPTIGANLELTIDEYLQYVVERELRAGVIENRAAAGSAIVMDPRTGEILAMANYPTFNPNDPNPARQGAKRNRAVQDMYEPGSTFKIVTASAALEKGVVRTGDLIDTTGGRIAFGSDVIRDTHDYKVLSFDDVIVKSSNVGAIKVALDLGASTLTDYVKRFGFGRRSSPRDFPGESPGIVWEAARLKASALARVSIGYQVSVTPLQMAAAMSAIANGGELLQPRVVRAVIRPGQDRQVVPRRVVNRAVSPAVAAELTGIMEAVVERGTATQARIPDYTVAGKTGTATKVVDGRYSRTDYNASFAGFVPSRRPAYTIVVVIDSPHGPNGYYGGPVSAPIFRRIAEGALRYGKVPPTLNAPSPVLVQREGDGPREIPVSGPTKLPATALAVYAQHRDSEFPDLAGMSARDALGALARLGLETRIHGTGFVLAQRPLPGTPIDPAVKATLWLGRERPDADHAEGGAP